MLYVKKFNDIKQDTYRELKLGFTLIILKKQVKEVFLKNLFKKPKVESSLGNSFFLFSLFFLF